MSKHEKLLRKLKSYPKDFTWNELVTLLSGFGFEEFNKGKTSGSRRRFVNENQKIISLHKPHPGNELKTYMIKIVLNILKEEGLI
ncbi:type II toxin-antitoxin system HicA family toxin [Ekhidna sp.]|uniref:type II toxin-antitoxin system HicA family toxin n=1 Tax=Ekhidna sp. TaxID=2608089 RepID=UPI0035190416